MITLSILVNLIGRNPDLDGLATYYVGPGPVTRSGEPFSLDMPIVAVDTSYWPEWAGRTLLIVSDDGHVAALRIADTGNLHDAGLFYRSAYSRYFVPADSAAAWGLPHRVVADIPERTFRSIFGDSETRRVWCWVMEAAG